MFKYFYQVSTIQSANSYSKKITTFINAFILKVVCSRNSRHIAEFQRFAGDALVLFNFRTEMGGVRPKAMNLSVPPACETTRATKPSFPPCKRFLSVVNNELKASQLGDSVQF